ncbi:hypothetical protein [Anaerolinea thermophila]|nr:hypothetical protein [Anaerolinea thermophila]
MIFLLLAGVLLVGLLAVELSGAGRGVDPQVVSLKTQPATATRTPGWWSSVATWTPGPTADPTREVTETVEERSTPTPLLDIPPVRTVEMPTPQPTWTRRP